MKIGNILKSINNDLVSVKVLNYCTNLSALAKETEKHLLPMIAIKHVVRDKLSVFETNHINTIPGKFKDAVNLNEDYTQYGTNHWKRKPSGCATKPHGKKWYGRYNCPFTDKPVNVQPPCYTKEEAVALAQAEVEIAWEEFCQKFSCYIRPPTHKVNPQVVQ